MKKTWMRRLAWLLACTALVLVGLYNAALHYQIPHASRYARWIHFSRLADSYRPGTVEYLRYHAMSEAYKNGTETYEFETSINPAIGGQ